MVTSMSSGKGFTLYRVLGVSDLAKGDTGGRGGGGGGGGGGVRTLI